MQVAEVLSDLTSLRVCDPSAALALVSVRPGGPAGAGKLAVNKDLNGDPDLKRAKDLIELHASVKMAHQDGTDKELNDARDAVEGVLREL